MIYTITIKDWGISTKLLNTDYGLEGEKKNNLRLHLQISLTLFQKQCVRDILGLVPCSERTS